MISSLCFSLIFFVSFPHAFNTWIISCHSPLHLIRFPSARYLRRDPYNEPATHARNTTQAHRARKDIRAKFPLEIRKLPHSGVKTDGGPILLFAIHNFPPLRNPPPVTVCPRFLSLFAVAASVLREILRELYNEVEEQDNISHARPRRRTTKFLGWNLQRTTTGN